MDTWMIVAIVVGVVVLAAVGLWLARTRAARRTARLSDRFGPEYERVLRESPRRDAERELESRVEHHDELELRPLDEAARARYAEEWTGIQARFVDAPESALREADHLVRRLLVERGYGDADPERTAADVSVDHPAAVERLRSAREVVTRLDGDTSLTLSDEASPSLDDMRRAMVDYRALVEDMLRADVHATATR